MSEFTDGVVPARKIVDTRIAELVGHKLDKRDWNCVKTGMKYERAKIAEWLRFLGCECTIYDHGCVCGEERLRRVADELEAGES